MIIGSFEVPEVRLYPTLVTDMQKIYDNILSGEIGSNDLAKLLGYVANTSGTFYRKLASIQSYGLLEGRGTVRVSDLGKRVAHPEDDKQRRLAMRQAILHVKLWDELYRQYKKNPPLDTFWVQIKNITGIESPKAQKIQSQVRKWYMEDVAQISDDLDLEDKTMQQQESKGLSSKEPHTTSMSQIVTEIPTESFGRVILPNVGFVDVADEDTLEIARTYFHVLEKKVKSAKESKVVTPVSELETQPQGS